MIQTSELGHRSIPIYQKLRALIAEGQIPVGEKIPTEMELCRQHGVSRDTVRRAVKRLEAEGILKARAGDGTRVIFRPMHDGHPPRSSQIIAVMSPYETSVAHSVQAQVLAKGYFPCFYFQRLDWDPEPERQFLTQIRDRNAHALLAYPTAKAPVNADLLDEIRENGTRVIEIVPYRNEAPTHEYCMFDYVRAGHMAAMTLLLSRYDHIVYGRPFEAPSSRLVEQGFRAALEEHGALDRFRAIDIPINLLHREESQQFMRETIGGLNGTVGLFAAWSTCAGDLFNLRERLGWDMPGRVGLLGLEEAPRFVALPQVDTVHFDFEELYRQAVDAILETPDTPITQLLCPTIRKKGTLA